MHVIIRNYVKFELQQITMKGATKRENQLQYLIVAIVHLRLANHYCFSSLHKYLLHLNLCKNICYTSICKSIYYTLRKKKYLLHLNFCMLVDNDMNYSYIFFL